MNSDVKMARRYYWISDNVHSTFLSKPHSGIICDKTHHNELDITAHDSVETQKTSLDLVKGNPQNLISSIKKLNFVVNNVGQLDTKRSSESEWGLF